jgi:hypothetical protein
MYEDGNFYSPPQGQWINQEIYEFAKLVIEEFVPESTNSNCLIYRLQERARIRRQIPGRKSVEENKPDRIADLLDEAATELLRYRPPPSLATINQLEELLILQHQAFQSIKELVKHHAFENEPVRLNQQPSWASEVMHIAEKFA